MHYISRTHTHIRTHNLLCVRIMYSFPQTYSNIHTHLFVCTCYVLLFTWYPHKHTHTYTHTIIFVNTYMYTQTCSARVHIYLYDFKLSVYHHLPNTVHTKVYKLNCMYVHFTHFPHISRNTIICLPYKHAHTHTHNSVRVYTYLHSRTWSACVHQFRSMFDFLLSSIHFFGECWV